MAATDIVEIDPRGDVVLICGSEANGQRLRVSSAILSQASQIFNALLSPRFKEGTELAARSAVEIPLPDDDPTSMMIICQVLHMQNHRVPHTLKPAELIEIAVLTDKYACMEAMAFVANFWTAPLISTSRVADLTTLLVSTFYFEEKLMFEAICRTLVWCSAGPIKAGKDSEHYAVAHVLDGLNHQRMRALGEITQALEDLTFQMISTCESPSNPPCGSCGNLIGRFTKYLAAKKLWPSSRREAKTLEQLVAEIGALDLKPEPGVHVNCDRQGKEHVVKRVKNTVRELEGRIKVPCFNCIREDDVGFRETCSHR